MSSNVHEGKIKVLMDQVRKMTGHVIDWKSEIGTAAGPFLPTDTKESWLARAHARVRKINNNVSFKYIERLFYGRVNDPKFSVASSVLSAAEQAREEQRRRENIMLASRFETLAGGLNARDEDFNREDINSLLHAAGLLRKMDCA